MFLRPIFAESAGDYSFARHIAPKAVRNRPLSVFFAGREDLMKALTKIMGMRSSLAGATVLSLSGLAAQASDGPYVAADYGYSGYETTCAGSARCDRRGSGFRVAAGWAFAQHWSVEALYLDAGRFDASGTTSGGSIFYGRTRLTAAGATVGYDWLLGNTFSIGPRAGVAAVKADFTPGPAPAIGGGATTAQFFGGAAAAWRISDAWCLHLDWDHTRARMNRFYGDVNVASVGVQFGF
jgi:Outer membrane protein beta-barrel domain